MTETFHSFRSHIERVNEQYGPVKAMKERLPPVHVLVQMDFSENHTCSTLDEIQSAYWNSLTVTLYPAVIYYRDHENELKHSSYVYVSEVLHHNASMVVGIIHKLVKTVKAVVQNLEYIHFWTDTPSLQYFWCHKHVPWTLRATCIMALLQEWPRKRPVWRCWNCKTECRQCS